MKLSFKSEGGMKTFSDKLKWGEFITGRPTVQGMLRLFSVERKMI